MRLPSQSILSLRYARNCGVSDLRSFFPARPQADRAEYHRHSSRPSHEAISTRYSHDSRTHYRKGLDCDGSVHDIVSMRYVLLLRRHQSVKADRWCAAAFRTRGKNRVWQTPHHVHFLSRPAFSSAIRPADKYFAMMMIPLAVPWNSIAIAIWLRGSAAGPHRRRQGRFRRGPADKRRVCHRTTRCRSGISFREGLPLASVFAPT